MTKSRVKTASVELIQNQMILMLLVVGLTSLLLLLYGIFSSSDSIIKYIETTLGINAVFALIFGILLPQKLGSVTRLYRLGLMRMDILKTYVYVALMYIVNTVTLILFIGIIINVLPLLNNLNSTFNIEFLLNLVMTILFTFGLYIAGVVITVTLRTNILFVAFSVIIIVLTIDPLFSQQTGILSMISPIILIVLTGTMLLVTLRAYNI